MGVSGGPEKDLEIAYSSGPEKGQLEAWQMFYCCWCWLTEEEAEAGLVAVNILAVRRWWLEERLLVLVCWLVKMATMCQSVGSTSKSEDF